MLQAILGAADNLLIFGALMSEIAYMQDPSWDETDPQKHVQASRIFFLENKCALLVRDLEVLSDAHRAARASENQVERLQDLIAVLLAALSEIQATARASANEIRRLDGLIAMLQHAPPAAPLVTPNIKNQTIRVAHKLKRVGFNIATIYFRLIQASSKTKRRF